MPRIADESSSRFPVDIPPAIKAILMRAAALEHTSLKDFMVRNALQAAKETIAEAERMTLNAEQTRFLLDLLDNPPAPTQKLRMAAKALQEND